MDGDDDDDGKIRMRFLRQTCEKGYHCITGNNRMGTVGRGTTIATILLPFRMSKKSNE